MRVLGWLDWPPVWLIGFLALVRLLQQVSGSTVTGDWSRAVAILIAAVGGGLMLLAAGQMVLARTTVIPREAPAALVTGGIFRISRNPIYLGDVLIVIAACFWWGVPFALILVPLFGWILQVRFIRAEEQMLRRTFGAEFEAWAARVRRWV